MTETFDIAIVGAGITGCAIARQLARFDLSICVVEAANDIALGASKANGGLVHAGHRKGAGQRPWLRVVRYVVAGAGLSVLPHRVDGIGL